MSKLFKQHLAKLTKAEEMDKEQDDPAVENDKDDMPITTEATLNLQAEDGDEDEDDKVEASDDGDEDDEDEVVAEVADAVEDEMDKMAAELYATLKKQSPKVVAAVMAGLNNYGILMKSAHRVDFKKVKYTASEKQLIKTIVEAARETAEDLLKAASHTLAKHGKTRRHARALDQALLKDGYLKSRIANPVVEQVSVRKAEKAVRKARK